MAQIVTLSDVCDFLDNQRKPITAKDRVGGPYPYYGANGILDYVSDYLFDEELVLLAEDGGFFDDPKRGVAYRVSGKCWVNNHAHVLRPKNNIDVDYLGYVLKQYDVRPYVTGATVKKITQKAARKLTVPLPPLEDQKRIVRELDAADQLRQKRKQAIALLDDYLKSFFLEMFGDPVTNSKGWKIQRLGEMIDFMTSGSRGWAKYYADAGDVFLRIQNVQRNHLQIDDLCFVHPPATAESKRTKVRPGDVLLSITADLGRTAVIPENLGNAYISQHLALLRFKAHYLPDYISEFLASQGGALQMAKLNKGGTKAGLNFNDIKSIQIPIPDIKTQQAYIAQKTHIQSIKQSMLSQEEELGTNFSNLIQRIFTNSLS